MSRVGTEAAAPRLHWWMLILVCYGSRLCKNARERASGAPLPFPISRKRLSERSERSSVVRSLSNSPFYTA